MEDFSKKGGLKLFFITPILDTGRTPIITYQRRKHRRLNKRKLIGLPEGTTNDSCQEERVEPQS